MISIIAWTIYKFFIASASAYEVSCDVMDKNDVLRQIAKPTPELFHAIKKNVYNQLSSHFHQYTQTTEYKNLGVFLQDKKQEEIRKECLAKKSNRLIALPV